MIDTKETWRDYVKIQDFVDQATKLVKELNEAHKALEDLDVMVDIQLRSSRLTCTYTLEMMKTWDKETPELVVDWTKVMNEAEPGYTKTASYDGCEEKNDD